MIGREFQASWSDIQTLYDKLNTARNRFDLASVAPSSGGVGQKAAAENLNILTETLQSMRSMSSLSEALQQVDTMSIPVAGDLLSAPGMQDILDTIEGVYLTNPECVADNAYYNGSNHSYNPGGGGYSGNYSFYYANYTWDSGNVSWNSGNFSHDNSNFSWNSGNYSKGGEVNYIADKAGEVKFSGRAMDYAWGSPNTSLTCTSDCSTYHNSYNSSCFVWHSGNFSYNNSNFSYNNSNFSYNNSNFSWNSGNYSK